MSVTAISETQKMSKNLYHWRNDSEELDVFEAARYFSGASTEVPSYNTNASFASKASREERKSVPSQPWRSSGRMSLDMPMRNSIIQENPHHLMEKPIIKEKKYKQPSSPGGRLASFLNALFSQTSSKKKKSSKPSSTTLSVKDEDESPGGRRKRRSSISHFRSTSATNSDSRSLYSSSSSGFRTPPPCANTPTKCYKDLRSHSDHQQVLMPHNGQVIKASSFPNGAHYDDKRSRDYSWLDEKLKFSNGSISDQKSKNTKVCRAEKYPAEENKVIRKMDHVEYDAESDSSSDLFDLPNCDLDFYPNGLPVYESTHVESIKRGQPISSGAI